MPKSLPPRPNLRQLKNQAKELLKSHENGDPSVCETLRLMHRFSGSTDQEILRSTVSLQEMQCALARMYGFESWKQLKLHIESTGEHKTSPDLQRLPLVALRDIVLFPHMVVPLLIYRKKSILAVTEAMDKDKRLFFSMQKDASVDVPAESDIRILGTIGEIMQLLKLPDGTVRASFKGISRAKIVDFIKKDDFFRVDTEIIEEDALSHAEGRVIKRAVIEAFKEYAEISDYISKEEVKKISAITDSSEILDAVAAKLPFRAKDKQSLLETTSVKNRLSQLLDIIIYLKDDEFRKGEIINGIVQWIVRGDIIVDCGEINGILRLGERVPTDSYRRGDRIRAYIKGVLREASSPLLILSRIHPNFLVNLFKAEVPEISEGIVSIVSVAREPGVHAKIAVTSEDPDVDPVGACVGMKGSRVQNVVQELQGERVDIIPWDADHAKLVANALAPAEISRVITDKIDKSMKVIVPNESLSLAIGEQGINARLASKLTGWHVDILSEEGYGISNPR